jgi:hypothetical protein
VAYLFDHPGQTAGDLIGRQRPDGTDSCPDLMTSLVESRISPISASNSAATAAS